MKSRRYTAEQKAWAVAQMGPPTNRTIRELAKTSGITEVSLRTWRESARAQRGLGPADGNAGPSWSSAEKFRAVLETAPLSQAEVSQYCRTKAIQAEHLEQWRVACEQANALVDGHGLAQVAVDKPDAVQRVRDLERQLRRKDAALAEAAALLILGKKADAIWGKDEES
jgi:transposase-like protein